MASFSAPVTSTETQPPSLAERAARQVQTYWRVRMTRTLERLEREARRMLQLEEELSAFAVAYYEAVGDAAERLALLDQQLQQEHPARHASTASLPEMPIVMAQRDARAARRTELKHRYRSLAKDIHPDRAMVVEGAGTNANHMHTLNVAYQKGDLAGMLKLEAEILVQSIVPETATLPDATCQLDRALREVERAADTYAEGYRALLHSPINELMLRALSARMAGWDWTDAVVKRLERSIEEKERALAVASIAAIGEWRDATTAA